MLGQLIRSWVIFFFFESKPASWYYSRPAGIQPVGNVISAPFIFVLLFYTFILNSLIALFFSLVANIQLL